MDIGAKNKITESIMVKQLVFFCHNIQNVSLIYISYAHISSVAMSARNSYKISSSFYTQKEFD